MTATEQETDVCQDCEGTNDVIDGLCEECDHDYVSCSICDERFHEDNKCWHLFWTSSGEWGGAGSYDVEPEAHREEFLELLAVLHPKAVMALREAIRRHEYKWHLYGTIFGYDEMDARLCGLYYGQHFTQAAHARTQGSLLGGFGWLLSLEPGKTDAQDELTAKWITEWITQQPFPTVPLRKWVKTWRKREKEVYDDANKRDH